MDWSDHATYAFDVIAGEFVVATADGADLKEYAPVSALLKRVRNALGIEAAFIAEWAGGEPVVRCNRFGDALECDSLQALFGARLLAAPAADAPTRCHAVPVVTDDGIEHGTLCGCLPAATPDDEAVQALRAIGRLISRWFTEASLSLSGLMPLPGQSVMGALPLSGY